MRARASGSVGIASNQTNFRAAVADRRFGTAGGWAERLWQVGPTKSPCKAAAVECSSSTSALPLRPSTDVKEGAAMIARGNVLNRITLPEGTEASGPLTGYFCSATSKKTRAASLTARDLKQKRRNCRL